MRNGHTLPCAHPGCGRAFGSAEARDAHARDAHTLTHGLHVVGERLETDHNQTAAVLTADEVRTGQVAMDTAAMCEVRAIVAARAREAYDQHLDHHLSDWMGFVGAPVGQCQHIAALKAQFKSVGGFIRAECADLIPAAWRRELASGNGAGDKLEYSGEGLLPGYFDEEGERNTSIYVKGLPGTICMWHCAWHCVSSLVLA